MIDWLIAAIIGAGALALAWWQGRRNGRADERQRQGKTNDQTRKRMDDVDSPRGADDAREWLRKRGQSGRDL
ncbi:hypothetical protein BVG79_01106 [Ketogulonicigenium robustum]|uniref:Uncharacterized protein n=1 Tax=Ketogulonicigenium robustum TaxID=92947 RepID=A0A1W6NYX9_9RHOB|nr:hypothetical protein BVG79_01106 [Ketogulonicigenium robustum]